MHSTALTRDSMVTLQCGFVSTVLQDGCIIYYSVVMLHFTALSMQDRHRMRARVHSREQQQSKARKEASSRGGGSGRCRSTAH